MDAQTCCKPKLTAQAMPVKIPSTHMAFFCKISSTTYAMPVTVAKISMA